MNLNCEPVENPLSLQSPPPCPPAVAEFWEISLPMRDRWSGSRVNCRWRTLNGLSWISEGREGFRACFQQATQLRQEWPPRGSAGGAGELRDVKAVGSAWEESKTVFKTVGSKIPVQNQTSREKREMFHLRFPQDAVWFRLSNQQRRNQGSAGAIAGQALVQTWTPPPTRGPVWVLAFVTVTTGMKETDTALGRTETQETWLMSRTQSQNGRRIMKCGQWGKSDTGQVLLRRRGRAGWREPLIGEVTYIFTAMNSLHFLLCFLSFLICLGMLCPCQDQLNT